MTGRRAAIAGLCLGLTAAQALAQAPGQTPAQAGPVPPGTSTPAPVPYRGGVLPPPRSAVPEHAFAPLRPEPGDIWSEVRGWSTPEARRNATAAPAGPARQAAGTAQSADGARPEAAPGSETQNAGRRRGRATAPGPEASVAAAPPRPPAPESAARARPPLPDSTGAERPAAAGRAAGRAGGRAQDQGNAAPAGPVPRDTAAAPAEVPREAGGGSAPASRAPGASAAAAPRASTGAEAAPGPAEKPQPGKVRTEKPQVGPGAR